jgi:pimeloyl-ACP methyl ester carboxylesterase
MKDLQTTVNGRQLSYLDFGNPDAPCCFFFHGAPMSRLQLAPLEDLISAQGLRVIAPERPGYGRSSPQLGRSMADWAGDVAALADTLDIRRFLVAGHSSGGPYAVACAALLPERVSAALVMAGVTNMAWPDAWEGYLETETTLMRMLSEDAVIDWCTEHFGSDGSGFLAEPFDLPEPDCSVLTDQCFERAMIEAFRQGIIGYAQDLFVQGRPWPFDPARIAIPVSVVHGDRDSLLPKAHSLHTASLIPGATIKVLPGHGHLSILSDFPGLAAALAWSQGR